MVEPLHPVTLLPATGLREIPWKNGAGTTREIAGAAAFDGAPLWRLSLATIDRAAPFSLFPGVDRWLAVVAGAVALTGKGAPFPAMVRAGDAALDFAGECPVAGEPLGGTALVLNLMVRRSTAAATLDWQGPGQVASAAPSILVFAPTPTTVTRGCDSYPLAIFDTLRLDAGPAVHVDRPCLIAAITV